MRDLFSETFKKAKLSTYTISQEHAFYAVREEEEEEEKEESKKKNQSWSHSRLSLPQS